ncbi:cytochrome b-c1 complex subunit 8 [Peziza echinospora]|nr:cytochrome b-c1 complex subunit 8 [Peziza echinospora]
MGGGGGKIPGVYMGWWGNFGSLPQKGVTSYSISPNRQKPMAGALHNAIFNNFRKFRQSALYVIPPFIVAYYVMDWAEKRNHFLNSKEGRALYADQEQD